MNTTQLECFVSLARHLNYMRTAEDLHMTQPAVSRQIQSLENELGTKLFERTTRSVSLTKIGSQFLNEAISMLNIYYHSKKWISSYANDHHYPIKIGYNDPFCNQFISQILAQLNDQYHNITPSLIADQTDANLRKLVNGELDFVIGIKDASFKNDHIEMKVLHEDGFVCVISKVHELNQILKSRNQKTVSKEDVKDFRQIISIPAYLLNNVFSRGHYILPINSDLDNIIVSNTSEAYSLILANIGFAFIPEYLAIKNEQLEFYPWQESPHTPFGIYCHHDTQNNPLLHDFIKIAKKIYEDKER